MKIRPAVLCLAAASLLAVACSKQEPPAPAAAPPAPAAPAAAPAAPVPDGKALFEGKCGVCHGLDRATSRKETKEGWKEIVKRMQAKSPAISDGDAAAIVDYLASAHGK